MGKCPVEALLVPHGVHQPGIFISGLQGLGLPLDSPINISFVIHLPRANIAWSFAICCINRTISVEGTYESKGWFDVGLEMSVQRSVYSSFPVI